MAEVSRGGDGKKLSGGNGDTLWRDALKRVDSAACGPVISCSRGQERWRTELEWSMYGFQRAVELSGERQSTAAAERHAFGWRGCRSGGCGRSPWGAGAV